MVKDTLISKKFLWNKLKENSQKRDRLLCKVYDLVPEDLTNLRKGKLFKRLYEATVFLRNKGLSDQINMTILPAFIFEEWDYPEKYAATISALLSYRYRKERIKRKLEFNLDVPFIQLFREDIGEVYIGNLYDARKVYQNFVPGVTDWIRSLRIPVNIDENVAELLGFYWGDGSPNSDKRKRDGVSQIGLMGVEKK